jgi:hypothetical protein
MGAPFHFTAIAVRQGTNAGFTALIPALTKARRKAAKAV